MSDEKTLPDAELARLMQDISPAAARQLDAGLHAFATTWLFNGNFMRCRACGLSQMASQGARPFNHLEGCTSAGTAAPYPWRELANQLQSLATTVR